MINYASPVPPEDYKCATCGAHGCKLWRESAHFGPVVLLCVTCAGKAEGVNVSAVDETGRIPWKLGPSRTDQIGSRVPAVPHPTGSFWGYTSVPDDGVKWWKALPTRGDEAHLAEQAAAAASPTPIDPGSPVTAEQAEATLTRLLAAAAAKGYEKGRDDERRRATHHAHALAARAFSAPVAYPAVLATCEAISSGKAAT